MKEEGTTFYELYVRFLNRITDDLLMELTPDETVDFLQDLLISSIPSFNFPKFDIYDYDLTYEYQDTENDFIVYGKFNTNLTEEEKDILLEIMLKQWYERQLANTRLISLRYSTAEFKMSSQANHMQRLQTVIKEQEKIINHKQKMYGRRIMDEKTRRYKGNYDWMINEKNYLPIFTRVGEG